METRINKYFIRSRFCSRREASRLLEQGRITINGKNQISGTKVSDAVDEILRGWQKHQKNRRKHVYIGL